MIMNFEIRHLQLVRNIERLGSLSASAAAMHITQPAASHLLKNLENRLGAPVYRRTNRKMVLTRTGQIVLDAALDILPRLDSYQNRLQTEIQGETGTLRIATECHTSYAWLPRVLKTFQATFPRIDVQINVAATGDPLRFLEEGAIDIAIAIDPQPDDRFAFHELFEDELLLVVPRGHRLRTADRFEAADWGDEHLLMYPEPLDSNSFARRVLLPAGIRPEQVTCLQLTEAIIEMVQAGMGVTAMSDWLLRPYLKSHQLRGIRITPEGLFRKWAMVTPNAEHQPRHHMALIQHFHSAMQTIKGG